ncbi:MAG TPA: inorganic diphosphatase [Ktedonobacterales bacterium]|jgi:inorganic pyrophosphatase|nr:inorganic diphosphatase [Ktedonobacterales bacterium]
MPASVDGDTAGPIEWDKWERLLRERGIVLDRPLGSPHPRYADMTYPLDYGYIPCTIGGDGAELDVLVSSDDTGLTVALVTFDRRKGDRELKLLWNTTENEIGAALDCLNRDALRALLHRSRPVASVAVEQM